MLPACASHTGSGICAQAVGALSHSDHVEAYGTLSQRRAVRRSSLAATSGKRATHWSSIRQSRAADALPAAAHASARARAARAGLAIIVHAKIIVTGEKSALIDR